MNKRMSKSKHSSNQYGLKNGGERSMAFHLHGPKMNTIDPGPKEVKKHSKIYV
jgi:hypothetical protein